MPHPLIGAQVDELPLNGYCLYPIRPAITIRPAHARTYIHLGVQE